MFKTTPWVITNASTLTWQPEGATRHRNQNQTQLTVPPSHLLGLPSPYLHQTKDNFVTHLCVVSRPFLLPLTGLFVHDNPPPPSLLIIIILIPIIIYIDTRGRGSLYPASRTSCRSRWRRRAASTGCAASSTSAWRCSRAPWTPCARAARTKPTPSEPSPRNSPAPSTTCTCSTTSSSSTAYIDYAVSVVGLKSKYMSQSRVLYLQLQTAVASRHAPTRRRWCPLVMEGVSFFSPIEQNKRTLVLVF